MDEKRKLVWIARLITRVTEQDGRNTVPVCSFCVGFRISCNVSCGDKTSDVSFAGNDATKASARAKDLYHASRPTMKERRLGPNEIATRDTDGSSWEWENGKGRFFPKRDFCGSQFIGACRFFGAFSLGILGVLRVLRGWEVLKVLRDLRVPRVLRGWEALGVLSLRNFCPGVFIFQIFS